MATTATAFSQAGNYGITQGSLSAGADYAISFVPGTLTVEPLALPATVAQAIHQEPPSLVVAAGNAASMAGAAHDTLLQFVGYGDDDPLPWWNGRVRP